MGASPQFNQGSNIAKFDRGMLDDIPAAEEPAVGTLEGTVTPNQRQDLIPHRDVIQARLDENRAEARILRRLYRLSQDAEAERGERKAKTNGSQEEAGYSKAKG